MKNTNDPFHDINEMLLKDNIIYSSYIEELLEVITDKESIQSEYYKELQKMIKKLYLYEEQDIISEAHLSDYIDLLISNAKNEAIDKFYLDDVVLNITNEDFDLWTFNGKNYYTRTNKQI